MNGISENLASNLMGELGISDENSITHDMNVVTPSCINTLGDSKANQAEKDFQSARTVLTETMEQTQAVIRATSLLIQKDPSPRNIELYHNLVKSMNILATNLFDLHIKLNNERSKTYEYFNNLFKYLHYL